MTNDQKHTPLPWYICKDEETKEEHIGDAPEAAIIIGSAHSREDRTFIVTACNSHYELLEALKQITEDAEGGRMTQSSINKAKKAIAKAEGR